METITVIYLLDRYIEWVNNDDIQFLSNNTESKVEVISYIKILRTDIAEAEKRGYLSDNLDWAHTHEHGRILWEKLTSCALNAIESDSKGNSELFKFIKAATDFEDILYGLEDYYRDHTLHSLWVYFIGEYILREHIPEIARNLNWYLYNDIETESHLYSQGLISQAKNFEKEINKEVNKYKDAIWCIIALSHDLGYSLSKLEKLNEKALNVLAFLDMPNFRHIGYSMDIEHQHLMTQFLDLLSVDVRIVPSIPENEILVKCYRDDSTFWRLCRAVEKKQHGIYSSYLIYKLLDIFADTYIRGTGDEWGLNKDEIVYNIIRGDICKYRLKTAQDYG